MTKLSSLAFAMAAVFSLNFGIASAEDPPETPQIKPETQTQPETPSSSKKETSNKKPSPSNTTKPTETSAEPDCE
ncbi:MAG: hypothetical protein ACYCZA_05910 [Thiobacillus sp.]